MEVNVGGVQRELMLRHFYGPQPAGARRAGGGGDGAAPAVVRAVVARAALAERQRQGAAEAERAAEYWPVRVQKGERPSLQPRKDGERRRPPPAARAGEHPRSLLADGERVHGPSKGLPIWNAGTLAYEPYALLSADLAERPNFHLGDGRTRGRQPFRLNFPLPVTSRRAGTGGLTRELLEAHSDGGGAGGEGTAPQRPASPSASVGAPTTLAPADAPPAYLARMAYGANRRQTARPAGCAPALRARPPVAGAIAPRASPADTAFRRAKDAGDVPLTLGSGAGGRPVTWTVEPRELDRRAQLCARVAREGGNPGAAVAVPRYSCAQLLALCVEGVRELEPTYHLLALFGATELIAHLSRPPDALAILPLVPQLVPHLRTALSTRQPMVVCAALKLLQQLAGCHARAARALLPGLPSLLPLLALWVGADLRAASGAGAAKSGEMEWAQHRRVNLGALTDELLEMLALACGPEGARLIRSHVPTWSTAAPGGGARVQLAGGGVAGFAQRGFSAPARGRGGSAAPRPVRAAAAGARAPEPRTMGLTAERGSFSARPESPMAPD